MELTPDPVQGRYARWLAWGTRLGLAFLVFACILYLGGAAPHVPIERMPELWKLPASTHLEQAGLRPGWHWAAFLHRSDMLVIAAIAFLSTCSVACLAAVLPVFRKRGENIFVAICILQIAVLLFAASGILSTGH